MGVYIKGMKMPKDEAVALYIYPDGRAKLWRPQAAVSHEFKAVFVPPHGRVIDADALKENWTHRDLDLFAQGWGYLKDLNRAPTIIPADLAEEGEK